MGAPAAWVRRGRGLRKGYGQTAPPRRGKSPRLGRPDGVDAFVARGSGRPGNGFHTDWNRHKKGARRVDSAPIYAHLSVDDAARSCERFAPAGSLRA